jgi:hypothetical protein
MLLGQCLTAYWLLQWAAPAVNAAPKSDAGELNLSTAIVVLKITPKATDAVRAKYETNFATGLRDGGLVVLPPLDSRRLLAGKNTLAECTAPNCAVELGAILNVPYLVRASVETSRRVTTYLAQVLRASDGVEIASVKYDCRPGDPCAPATEQVREIGQEAARRAAQEIREHEEKRQEELRARPSTDGAQTAPATDGNVRTPSDPQREQPAVPSAATDGAPAASASKTTWPYFVAIGAGVAALGTGVALLAINGSGTDCTGPGGACFGKYDTGGPGWGLTVGGGVLAIGGAIAYFVWGTDDAEAARPKTALRVDVGPTGLSLHGRF